MKVHSCLQVDEVDESLLTQLAYNARGDICPMQGVIGGITAQEVMKVWHYVLSFLDIYWVWIADKKIDNSLPHPWHLICIQG